MSAEVETMFYLRKEPWHGLGTQVMEAPNSREALKLAGLDWKVVQEPLITGAGDMVDGYKANVRNTDNQVLGVVGDRYRIVQNEEAFASLILDLTLPVCIADQERFAVLSARFNVLLQTTRIGVIATFTAPEPS